MATFGRCWSMNWETGDAECLSCLVRLSWGHVKAQSRSLAAAGVPLVNRAVGLLKRRGCHLR